ncbi:MAG: tRNA (guanosine(46)-N7)-methyltransferase TrmB [Bacteroidales bacterium]|nr:tRNA (guanosine(46)-N7)-methyltransferase TrmB [Bacteroidales bacterium]
MSKGKLAKFAEVEGFNHVIQPPFEEVFQREYFLKGKWNQEFFKVPQAITLELGCGKGEYSVGLARMYPERNFLGIDIKGSRIWRGARQALDEGLTNVGFLRTRIDFIESFFSRDEVNEIWITFPDPQLKKQNKRLTSTRFLNRYRKILRPGGSVNLKTDSVELYRYTRELVLLNGFSAEVMTDDLYRSDYQSEILSIKTFYENMWLEAGKPIHYIRFQLHDGEFKEPPDENG